MLIRDGSLIINKCATIRPQLSLESFLASDLAKNAIKTRDYKERVNLKLQNCILWNKNMNLILYFWKNRLVLITMALSSPSSTISSPQSLDELKQILKDNLGEPPYEFEWGTVIAAYDDRAGFSKIQIQYNI